MELAFFFLHISRAQCHAPARTRTQVVWLRAQCTDHWTTEQSCGVGMPTVHLTMHAKSSTLYGHMVVRSYSHKSKFFRLNRLLWFCIKMAYHDDCQGRHGTRRKQTNYLNGRSHPGIELATVQVFYVEKSRFTTSIKKYPRNFFPDNWTSIQHMQ